MADYFEVSSMPSPTPSPSPRPSPTPRPTPTPSPSPSPDSIWLFEKNGTGKLVVLISDFKANDQSGRGGALAWDACAGGTFDNGHPIVPQGTGSVIGSFGVVGNVALKTSSECGLTISYDDLNVSQKEYTVQDGRVA